MKPVTLSAAALALILAHTLPNPAIASTEGSEAAGPNLKVNCLAKQSMRGESPLIVTVELNAQAADRMTLKYAGEAALGEYRIVATQTSQLRPRLASRAITITTADGLELAKAELEDEVGTNHTQPRLVLSATLDWNEGRKRSVICVFAAN